MTILRTALLAVIGCLALVLLVTVSRPGRQSPTTLLRWRLEQGQTLHYHLTQSSAMTVHAGNQTFRNAVNQALETTWTVRSVDSKGAAEIAMRVDRLKASMDFPVGKVAFDSEVKTEPIGKLAGDFEPVLRALVGAEVRFRLGPLGEVGEVQLPGAVNDAIQVLGGDLAAGGLVAGPNLRMLLAQSIPPLPEHGLDRGKTWTTRRTIPAGNVGATTLDSTFTYRGPETTPPGGPAETIDQSVRAVFTPDPESHIEAKITDQAITGRFALDKTAGRLRASNLSQSITLVSKVRDMNITQDVATSASMTLADADVKPSASP
ncbi:MAG: hypothetical protein ABI353_17910 [Isosphaeraceae bacterium]